MRFVKTYAWFKIIKVNHKVMTDFVYMEFEQKSTNSLNCLVGFDLYLGPG